ncbi:MAG TPA: haloacid dehalogenase type II [Bauldia sp.]|nr:haloacid dehalogenase type II [Bauldia sp.]
MRLTDFKVLTFDCYGTLIDWETGMVEALKPLTSRLKAPLSRNHILEAHARHEASQQEATPGKRYSDLLAVVFKRLAEEWGVHATWDEALAYGNSIRDWPAFPDSAKALQYLKSHYKLVILSNVDNLSFAHSNRRLQVEFDAIYTAEDIGSYKPSERNFAYMLAKLEQRGIAKADILHTAESLFHDHVPAKKVGLATAWIHRRHAEEGSGATLALAEPPKTDFRFTSMAALAEAHRSDLERG